jgi:hypothetical protein
MDSSIVTRLLRAPILGLLVSDLRRRIVVDALHDARDVENEELLGLAFNIHRNELHVPFRNWRGTRTSPPPEVHAPEPGGQGRGDQHPG